MLTVALLVFPSTAPDRQPGGALADQLFSSIVTDDHFTIVTTSDIHGNGFLALGRKGDVAV